MKVRVPKINIQTKQPDYVTSPIKLTISLLVSNRIQTIRKCMESLKPILQAVPSELIAVDTIGEDNSDGSLDVVREYTDQIVHFDWTGDFSAARNAGLELAKGEWFLYVDDDEWFDDPTEIIEFFQTGEYMEYGFAQYTVRNYFDESFSKYSIGWVSRMIHRTPEMRFIHPVHEMFFPFYHPEKKFTRVFAHHVGYVFKNQEEREQHSQRNLPPLLKELERYPHNLRILMQIVQEYQFREEYETAEEYCRRGEENEDRSYEPAWNWIMSALVAVQAAQEKWEKTLTEGRRILELPRLNELARMNIVYLMCLAAERIRDFEKQLENAKEYIRLAQYFDENPDRLLEQVILSLGDVLLEDRQENIYNSLFSSCKSLERYEELCVLSKNMNWGQPYMHKRLYWLLLAEAAAKTGDYDCLTQMVEKICTLEPEPAEWMDTIQEICQQVCKEQFYLRKAIARVNTDKPYFLLLKAWCAEQDGGNVASTLQKCLEHGMDCAVPREELLGICLRAGIDPTPFLEPLYLEDWVVSFSQLVKNTPKDELQHLLDCAQNILRPLREQQYFVLSKMIRQRMLDDPAFPEGQLWETARAYADNILGYYQRIYRTELFENTIKQNLPREAVFALKLQEALHAQQQGHLEGMTQALKECVKAYPPQKKLVNRLLKQVELDIQAEQQYQDEFIEMGEKIKQQVHEMIRSGKLMEARQILEQLRVLLPNDAELEELEQKISMVERLKNLQSFTH